MAGAREIRAGKAYVELSTKDKLSQGLSRAQARLRAFGAVCQRMGRSLFTVGGAALAGLGAASKVFADFEKQMAMVSTMLDRPVAHMARFKEAVRDMAVSSGQSTETIAKGLYDILSASVAPEKALGFLRVALHAAAGGMTDVATATKGMIRILRAYDMDATQAADISDTLFTVVKKGVITYEELAEHIGTVAPSARAAGLTLQQLAAAVATVVSVEEPTRAMTALRQAIFEAAEEGTDLLSFVREFKGADLAKVIAAGIPKRAAQGVVILAGNLALLDENLAAMAARAGAGEEAYKKMAGTLTKAFNQAKQAVVVAAGRIGEALAPVLRIGSPAPKRRLNPGRRGSARTANSSPNTRNLPSRSPPGRSVSARPSSSSANSRGPLRCSPARSPLRSALSGCWGTASIVSAAIRSRPSETSRPTATPRTGPARPIWPASDSWTN